MAKGMFEIMAEWMGEGMVELMADGMPEWMGEGMAELTQGKTEGIGVLRE